MFYKEENLQAFWLFGIISAIFGGIYTIFVSIFLLTKKKTARKQDYGKGDGQDSEKADSLNEGKEKAQEMESFLEKQPDSPSDGLRRDSPIGSSAT